MNVCLHNYDDDSVNLYSAPNIRGKAMLMPDAGTLIFAETGENHNIYIRTSFTNIFEVKVKVIEMYKSTVIPRSNAIG